MATLEKIRKRSVLLFSIIIIALLAFILGDFLNSGRSFFSDPTTASKVDGHKIDIQELNNRINNIKQQDQSADDGVLREQVLQAMIDEILFNEEIEKLGIVVTDNELSAFMFPENNPEMKAQMQQFYDVAFNPTKYGLSEEQAASYRAQWDAMQQQAIDQLKHLKYNQLLQATLVPNKLDLDAERNLFTNSTKVLLASKSTAGLKDDDFAVTDEEIAAEYEKYQNSLNFRLTEPVRAIDYVVVNVTPSDDDRAAAQAEVNNAVAQLKTDKETESVNGNYNFRTQRIQATPAEIEMQRSQMQQQIMRAMQSGQSIPTDAYDFLNALAAVDTIPVGDLWVAPANGDNYTMLKLIARNEVKSDSDSVASTNLDFAIIQYTIEPSEATRANIKQKLAEFANANNTPEKIEAAAAEAGYTVQHDNITPSTFFLRQYAPNGQQMGNYDASYDAAHWAIKADKGAVSGVMSNDRDDRFMVVAVKDIYEGDVIPLSDARVKDMMTTLVRDRKKTDKLINDYKGKAKTIEEYATLMMGPEATPREVNMQVQSMNYYGQEVAGAAAAAQKGQLVGPIAGNGQVVVFKVVDKTAVETPVTPDQLKSQYVSRLGGDAVVNRLSPILRHDKKIETRVHDLMGE